MLSTPESLIWAIAPISSPTLQWGVRRGDGTHHCPMCNIVLLTGENLGFYCGPGGLKFTLT